MVFSGFSIVHCKQRVQVPSRVVLPSNSRVGEPFALPPNSEFTREYSGFFGQCERRIRQQVSSY